MATRIDAIGKACPLPVIMAKKAIDEGQSEIVVAVDNAIAVENLKRLAASRGLSVSVEGSENRFEVSLAGDAATAVANAACNVADAAVSACGYAVFIGKDFVGDGDRTLGANLMKMLLYTLSQSAEPPSSLLFMNAGVQLPTSGEQQVIDSIKALEEKGTEVLVCGACLNFFGIADQLKAGTVSNMYEILLRMQTAAKVITV
ncbi:MAG: sulfurtransferase-like selenium metabolism protein YedF [Bacillota bacterium]